MAASRRGYSLYSPQWDNKVEQSLRFGLQTFKPTANERHGHFLHCGNVVLNLR